MNLICVLLNLVCKSGNLPPTLLFLNVDRNSSDGRVMAAFRWNLSESWEKPAYRRAMICWFTLHNRWPPPTGGINQTKKAHPVSQDELDIMSC